MRELVRLAAAVTLFHAATSAAAETGQAANPPEVATVWKPLAPGVERGLSDDGDVRLQMFRFDLERYDAEVVVAGRARPPHARIWLPGARHTAAEVLHDGGGRVVAAVNGGFFDDNGRSLGLRTVHDDVVVPLRGNVDWGVLYVAARRARIVHSRDFIARPGIDAAVQVGPRILIDGAVPRLKPQSARRTCVALDREGRTLTLVVADEVIDATILGSRLAALGFHSALLFDGGPSTQIAVAIGAPPPVKRGTKPNTDPDPADAVVRLAIPGGYAVPDLLAIVRR